MVPLYFTKIAMVPQLISMVTPKYMLITSVTLIIIFSLNVIKNQPWLVCDSFAFLFLFPPNPYLLTLSSSSSSWVDYAIAEASSFSLLVFLTLVSSLMFPHFFFLYMQDVGLFELLLSMSSITSHFF